MTVVVPLLDSVIPFLKLRDQGLSKNIVNKTGRKNSNLKSQVYFYWNLKE